MADGTRYYFAIEVPYNNRVHIASSLIGNLNDYLPVKTKSFVSKVIPDSIFKEYIQPKLIRNNWYQFTSDELIAVFKNLYDNILIQNLRELVRSIREFQYKLQVIKQM